MIEAKWFTISFNMREKERSSEVSLSEM